MIVSYIYLVFGMQFVSMALCSLVIARIVSFEALIKGICIGTCLVLLPLFKSGTYSIEGLFGSKNMVGLWSQVGIISSISFALTRAPDIKNKLFYILPTFLLSCVCMALSKSASSIISTLAAVGFIILGASILHLSSGLKKITIAMLAFGIVTVSIFIFAFQIDMHKEVLDFFGKDQTLTGRTDLWQTGIEIAKERIIIGHGYSAFWVTGNPMAESLWEEFFIPTKTGFHFHNLFIQILVDLGLIGLLIICMALISLWIKAWSGISSSRRSPGELFLLGFVVMISVRSFVEIDVLNPFGIGSFLFLVMLMFPSQPSINQKRDLYEEP